MSVWNMRNVADVPPEMMPAIEAHLKRVEHLVPSWITRIRVLYQSAPQDGQQSATASITVKPQYRFAVLEICPHWFDLSDEHRHETLVHEISHAPTRSLFNLVTRIIENCVSDEGVQAVMREEVSDAFEMATEDIKLMLMAAEKR